MGLLLVPGPVYVPRKILSASARPLISHRAAEFENLYGRVCDNLCALFHSDEAVVQTGSGTCGLETIVASSLSSDDFVLCLHNGDFGKRLCDMVRIYTPHVAEYSVDESQGLALTLERVKGVIDEHAHHDSKVLALVYNETATGVENELKSIVMYAKKQGYWTLVDTVSAFAGTEFDMKGWGVDITATGSQKAIGAPPGLSMIGVNSEMLQKIEKNTIRSYYCNLKKLVKFRREKHNQTPYTPAVGLLYGLDAAIERVLRMGLPAYIRRHKRAARYVRKELAARGFTLFAEKGYESNTVTSFHHVPDLKKKLEARGVYIGGGQGALKEKVLRIAHMGQFRMRDLKQFFTILDEILVR